VIDEIAALQQFGTTAIEDDVLVHPALLHLAGAVAPEPQQDGG